MPDSNISSNRLLPIFRLFGIGERNGFSDPITHLPSTSPKLPSSTPTLTLMLLLQPAELLRRLATLVPPPRAHLVRYHGVFAPASSWRSQVILPPPDSTPSASPPRASPCVESEDPAPAATEIPPPQSLVEVRRPADPSRIPWAELLLRVFREDVLACPCGGRRVVLAYLTQPGPVQAILH